MTDEPTTDAPEDDGVMEAMAAGMAASALSSAEGVGAMLSATAEFVDDRKFARVGNMMSPDGAIIPMILTPDGRSSFVSPTQFDLYGDAPRFRRGAAAMTSLDSFIKHINRFGDPDSAVFADDNRTAPKLLAVLDYHRQDTLPSEDGEVMRVHGDYRHGLHRTTFAFPVSDEWTAWHAANGTKMSMPDFAMFLEDNVLDVADVDVVPESASRFVQMNGGVNSIADWSTLTALAKNLTIFENAVVSEAVNLSSGEGQLTLQNAHDTEVAGVKVKVPTMFFIAIPIFREGVIYRLPVRLRYRKDRSGVVFWYELWRADRAFHDAFHDAVKQVETQTEAAIFYGKPEVRTTPHDGIDG